MANLLDGPAPAKTTTTPRRSTTKTAPRRTSAKKPLPAGRSFRDPKNEAAYRRYKASGGKASASAWYSKHKKKPNLLQRVSHAASAVGRGFKRAVEDVGETFSNVMNDVATANTAVGEQMISLAKGDVHRARRIGEDYAKNSKIVGPAFHLLTSKKAIEDVGRRVHKNPLQVLSPVLFSKKKDLEALQRSPASLIPGVNTFAQLRGGKFKEIGEHPGFALMDVLAAKGMAAGKASPIEELARDVPPRVVKPHPTLERFVGPLRDAASPRGTRIGKKIPQGLRQISKTVQEETRSVLTKAKESRLSPEQLDEVTTALKRGERPPDGSPLQKAYDSYKDFQEAEQQRRIDRVLPDEAKAMIKHKVLEAPGKKDAAPLITRLTKGLAPTLGEADAARIVGDQVDAFLSGRENPHPTSPKTWRQMELRYNRAVASQERAYKLYREPVTGQVYSYEEFAPLRRELKVLGDPGTLAQLQTRAGLGDPAAVSYIRLLKDAVPGTYRDYLHEARQLQNVEQARLLSEVGYGRGALRRALADIDASSDANWLDLYQRGVRPVHVHRPAVELPGEAEVPRLTPAKSLARPGSFKKAAGGAMDYKKSNAYVMLLEDQFDVVRQHTMLKTIGDLYDTADGAPYTYIFNKLKEADSALRDADIHAYIRDRFRPIDIERGRVSGLNTAPKPGDLLIPSEVAKVAHYYLDPAAFMKGDRFLSAWMIPTLWMAPIFQANNIIGGAFLTAMRTSVTNPAALFKAMKGAWNAARHGDILDVRVPSGSGLFPSFRKLLSPTDEVAAATLYGRFLGDLTKKFTPIQSMERMNQFFDGLYRNFIYLNKKAAGYPDEIAAMQAARLMQDWDSMLPIERQIFQRAIPFWNWKRTLVRNAFTYPVDHPFRMAVMNFAARHDAEHRDMSEFVEALLANMLPVGHPNQKGYQKYVSLRGVNPFADYANMSTFWGWMQSIHPLARTLLQTQRFDPRLGGEMDYLPADQKAIDPFTGMTIRKPDFTTAFFESIPQGQAIETWLMGKGPKPEDRQLKGALDWLDRYGASLRLTPGISTINVKEREKKRNERYAMNKRMLAAQREREGRPKKKKSGSRSSSRTSGSGNLLDG